MSLNRLLRPQPIGGAPLVQDYLDEAPAALKFFSGSPFRLSSYRHKVAEVTARFGNRSRDEIARALHPTSDAARDRLERFIQEGGVMVTTGQQAGLFTGPLYTIYKAISAAVLARHLEVSLGILVLPVFWVASEDHDWAEVNHVWLLDPGARLRRFELGSDDTRPLPMSERGLSGDLETLSDDVVQYIGAAGHAGDLVNRIVDPYRMSGRTVAAAFRLALGPLLGHFDMLLADAADPVLKRASLPVLEAALTEAERHETALAERSAEMISAGYSPQVAVLEGGTNLFLAQEGSRERLYRRGEDFGIRGRRETLYRQELLRELESDPVRFSPNVLLRPVVESHVFPTVAYVGGPGEIAYLAQVGALMGTYGIAPPLAVPRFSALVVEAAVERRLEKLGLSIDDLRLGWDELAEKWARREVPGRTFEMLDDLRRLLVQRFDELAEEVEGADVGLRGVVEGMRNRVLAHAGRVERKVLRSVKRRNGTALEQLSRLRNSIRPNGEPQDRVLNVLPFVARYGSAFLVEVEESILRSWRLPSDS